MLDLDLIVNVMIGIFAYKAIIGLIEITCIRILAMLLGKKFKEVDRKNRYHHLDKMYKEQYGEEGLQK